MNQKRCLIIDGNNCFYRCYYASQTLPLKNEFLGFFFLLRALISLVKNDNYHKLIFFFDAGRMNFRHAILENYKANRKTTPTELIIQTEFLQKILPQIGLTYAKLEMEEADDLIASFISQNSKRYPKEIFDIFSQDKDLMQLISPQINILKYIKNKNTIFTYEDFLKKYQFFPSKYVDYLSLLGDKSDNIKGIEKIGIKKAQQLIEHFGSLENIYQKLDEFSEKMRSLLIDSKRLVFQNKQLISLKKDITLAIDWNSCDFNWENWRKNTELRRICQLYQFNSIIKLLN